MRELHLQRPIVLAVSKLAPRENPGAIVASFARLRAIYPAASLVFVGEGPLKGRMRELAQALDVGLRTHFVGYVPYRRLASYYAVADLLVHAPSVEPWGISVAEAMACGVPVVATPNVGSAADLIAPGETGAFAVSSDPTDLADAMRRVIDMRGRERLGETTTARAEQVDVEKTAQELEILVSRLSMRPVFSHRLSSLDRRS
jgi:glycosyltransferase involved in cell wall biosynthesis